MIFDVGIILVPDIPCEDRTDHLFNIILLFKFLQLRVEHYILKTAFIPGGNEGAKAFHASLQGFGKIALPVCRKSSKLPIQHIGSQTGRFHGDSDTGGKDRVEKFAGIAQQGITVAIQALDVGAVTADGVDGGIKYRIVQKRGQARLLGNKLLQHGLPISPRNIEHLCFAHHTNTTSSVTERNQPIPDIAQFGVNDNTDIIAIIADVINPVFQMGKECLSHRKTGRFFQIQQARQYPAKTAGIQNEIGSQLIIKPILIFDRQYRFAAAKIGRNNFLLLAYFDPHALCFIDQQRFKAVALHLVGKIKPLGKFIGKTKFGMFVFMQKSRSGF